MSAPKERQLRASVFSFISVVGGISPERLEKVFKPTFPPGDPPAVKPAGDRKVSNVGPRLDFGFSKGRLWIRRSYLKHILEVGDDLFDAGHGYLNRRATFSPKSLAEYVSGKRAPSLEAQTFLRETIKISWESVERRLPVEIERSSGLVWFGLAETPTSSIPTLVTRGSDTSRRKTSTELVDECSGNDLIVAATILLATDEETSRAPEAIVSQLAGDGVRDALLRLVHAQLIRRVGDEIIVGEVERKAILRRARRGEPHDSYFYRAIEQICERITSISQDDARAIIDRIYRAFKYMEYGIPDVNQERGRKTARHMAGILAEAQVAVTPPASPYYAEAAVGFACSGDFSRAFEILRTSAAAKAPSRADLDCIFRRVVLDAAIFHNNREAFEECLAEGARLWIARAKPFPFAEPFPFAAVVKAALARGWRESLDCALTSGLAKATAEQREEVQKLLQSLSEATAEELSR